MAPRYPHDALPANPIGTAPLGAPKTTRRPPIRTAQKPEPFATHSGTRTKTNPRTRMHYESSRQHSCQGQESRSLVSDCCQSVNISMLSYPILCYALLCYAMLCYAMLCYATLRPPHTAQRHTPSPAKPNATTPHTRRLLHQSQWNSPAMRTRPPPDSHSKTRTLRYASGKIYPVINCSLICRHKHFIV